MRYLFTMIGRIRKIAQVYNNSYFWISILLIILISFLLSISLSEHWMLNLVFIQCYIVPIIITANRHGIRGGLLSASIVNAIYILYVIPRLFSFQEFDILYFIQIIVYFLIGYLSGFKATRILKKTDFDYKKIKESKVNLKKLQEQSEKLIELEEQLRLSGRLAVIGELTACLAHEIRNPLSTMISTIDVIKEECSEEINNNDFFQILIKETNRLQKIVESYLNFSKKQTMKETIYDLTLVLQDVKTMIYSIAKKYNTCINIEIPPSPLMMTGNAIHLWQVIVNLLLNALQSMNNGGEVSIIVKKVQAATVNLEYKGNGSGSEYLQLIICDQGTGISEENIAKIFQPFYSTKQNGTGLGLYIVKRIADENNWHITVQSEPNIGTQFELYLPLEN